MYASLQNKFHHKLLLQIFIEVQNISYQKYHISYVFVKLINDSLFFFKACFCYFHQIFMFSLDDSPSKAMKNAFYLI